MRHLTHSENPSESFTTAVLIKESALRRVDIEKSYVHPLEALGLDSDRIITFTLDYQENGKAPAGYVKAYLDKLLPQLKEIGVKNLLVCDSAYFKVLTKVQKVEPKHGYVVDSEYIEGFNCVVCPNYQQLFYDPKVQDRIDLAISTIRSFVLGSKEVLGEGIIHSEYFPKTYQEISDALDSLHQYEALTVDIEAYGLDFSSCGIGTIEFAWDKHNGLAFAVDCAETEPYEFTYWCTKDKKDKQGIGYHKQVDNQEVKLLLSDFFKTYKGKLIYHNANYDVKVLIYELFMNALLDYEGLLYGLEVMTRDIDDTKVIAYLVLNSCSRISLKLKELAHEFAGDYAEDVKDIRLIPLSKLLPYNIVDGLSTWFLFEKYFPIMIEDEQLGVYETIQLPSIKLLLQTELSGMPICMDTVLQVEKDLAAIKDKYSTVIKESKVVTTLEEFMSKKETEDNYQKRKSAAKNPDKTKVIERTVEFNEGSPNHLTMLMHDYLGLEITDTTDTGLAATGNKVIQGKLNLIMNRYGLTKEDLV